MVSRAYIRNFAVELCADRLAALCPQPESAKGFPFWLVMVWGPSLAALWQAHLEGELSALLMRVFDVCSVPFEVWLLIVSPLALLGLLKRFTPKAAHQSACP